MRTVDWSQGFGGSGLPEPGSLFRPRNSTKTGFLWGKTMLKFMGRLVVVLVGLWLAGCVPGATGTVESQAAITVGVASQTPTPATITPSATSATATTAHTPTPRPLPSSTHTPEPLAMFETRLNRDVQGSTYIDDQCRYLSDRWGEGKAQPGAVVVPVMYHGVRKDGGTVSDNITVTQEYFEQTMEHARKLGFETITSGQLVDFLHHNSYIPPRSMLLIIDDRRLGTVRTHFLPFLEKNNWTLMMAYITGVIDQREWNEIKEVLASGRVEIQAHGFMHNGQTYFTEFTTPEIIEQEIYGPIEAFREHINRRPTVFIWPGGNFTKETVAEVRTAGYQLGFTAFARGPVLYNWIPQGPEERAMQDPILLLPRYWSTAAYLNLDMAVEIGQQAAAFAAQNRQRETAWYARNCPGFPPLGQSDVGQ